MQIKSVQSRRIRVLWIAGVLGFASIAGVANKIAGLLLSLFVIPLVLSG
jgi:uncharacterized membrane protein YtjA (UPF0391 family)